MAKPWLVPTSTYLHVPFCRTKCVYCDFNTYAGKERQISEYVAALATELERRAGETQGRPLRTVYFGGGTPSLLSPAQVRRLMDTLRGAYGLAPNAEVTFEANPGTFGPAYLAALVAQGITRLSLGVQSLDDETLRRLARTHNAAQAIASVAHARAAGIASINLDLIYGLPWQSELDWLDHLQRALDTEPDHISLYALMVEEGTPLASLVAKGHWSVPDADAVADRYEAALPILERAGFVHYEVSNWARPGYESRHNLVYWRNEAYVGAGAGAHSYVQGRRFWNVRPIERYLRQIATDNGAGLDAVEGDERLPEEEQRGETAMLALRLRQEGLDFARFQSRFGEDPRHLWAAPLSGLAALGLLDVNAERATLTDAGLLVSNDIGARFL